MFGGHPALDLLADRLGILGRERAVGQEVLHPLQRQGFLRRRTSRLHAACAGDIEYMGRRGLDNVTGYAGRTKY